MKQTTTRVYEGTSLVPLFAEAHNWKNRFSNIIRPYVKGRVLEVGAADGASTRSLMTDQVTEWTSLDPDPSLMELAATRYKKELLDRCRVRVGTLLDLDSTELFDSITYLDVLEHIENDRVEIQNAFNHLSDGGHLIVLSPAHQFLYTPFDALVGHHRRYSLSAIRSLGQEFGTPIVSRYLDSCGLLASLGNKLFLRAAIPNKHQIQFWDRVLVPTSALIDPLFGYKLGKSALVIWTKGTRRQRGKD